MENKIYSRVNRSRSLLLNLYSNRGVWSKQEDNMGDFGKLNKIKLSGFKSIREMELDLTSLNILIGPNGVGKSNFIHFFRFMNQLRSKELQIYVSQKGTAERFLHFGEKETKSIQAHLQFDPNEYKVELVPTQEGKLIFKSEEVIFNADKIRYQGGIKRFSLANAGQEESGLPPPSTLTAASHVSGYIADWKIYHFHDTSDTSALKKVSNINDNVRLSPQGENLAAFLFSIQRTTEYQKIVETIQRVAPFFQDFILIPDKNNIDQIRLRWKHKGSDSYFDANSLSDGTLRFICLTTLLLQPYHPTVILLDEPELGLHPYAIHLLAAMIKSASTKTQIIASTQSVTLANQFEWQNIVIVEQKDGASHFSRLEESDVKIWLDDYKMGELWEKNLIRGTP